MNADTAEGFEPVMELHAAEGPVRSLTILLRGQPYRHSHRGGGGGETPDQRRRQIQVQGLAKEWSLGCVKRAPMARGTQDAGIMQPS